MRRAHRLDACLVGFLALCGCSSSSHGTRLGGGGQAGGDAGTSGSSGSSSGGEPSTGGTSPGGAGGANAGGASGGDTSEGGASGGTAGSAGGGAGGTGGSVVLPDYDYVAYALASVPQFGSLQVRGFDPVTGEEEFSGSIANPFPESDQYANPLSFVALPDGTLRAGWVSSGVTGYRIVELDADLNVLGVVTVPNTGNFVDYAVRADGSRALLGGGPGSATLTPLLADDSLDLSAALTTITASGPAPVAYFALAGSARLLWALNQGGNVTFLTANDEPTAVNHYPANTNTPGEYFVASGYHVAANGMPRISWTATSSNLASRVCTYASEDDLGTLPAAEGWGPGSCWRVPTTGYVWIRYATFRR